MGTCRGGRVDGGGRADAAARSRRDGSRRFYEQQLEVLDRRILTEHFATLLLADKGVSTDVRRRIASIKKRGNGWRGCFWAVDDGEAEESSEEEETEDEAKEETPRTPRPRPLAAPSPSTKPKHWLAVLAAEPLNRSIPLLRLRIAA